MALLHFGYYSEALCGLHVTVDIIVPDGDVPEHGHRVLWLLHGMSDDETMWQRRTSIERYADTHKIAVVMPDVKLSCYTDMSHGFPYYTFVTEELPRILRGYLALSSRREDNYVAGLSMGGEGAYKIGLSKPENYAAIGCFSAGAFNHPWVDAPTPETHMRRFLCYDGKTLDGIPEDCFENAKRILSEGKPIPRIYHAIGTEDFLLGAARETRDFFTALDGNPFDFTYEEHPGAHTWDFWDEHVQRFLDFIEPRR